MLNSPAAAQDRFESQPDEPTTIELTDLDGNPIGYQPFVVRRPDGSSVSGALDAEGKATLYLDDDAEVSFIGLRSLERC